uniref:PRO2214 n=1 Tax=Homo sapiens TaxID=9606 RepID=Q9P179_HUMAN|nr:PRO2214 [Homo sapiens]
MIFDLYILISTEHILFKFIELEAIFVLFSLHLQPIPEVPRHTRALCSYISATNLKPHFKSGLPIRN